MIMENPLDHWVRLMMGLVKPAKFTGGRVFINGQTHDEKEEVESVILKLLIHNGSMRPAEIIKMSPFKKTTIYRVLDSMVLRQVLLIESIETEGRKYKHYTIRKVK